MCSLTICHSRIRFGPVGYILRGVACKPVLFLRMTRLCGRLIFSKKIALLDAFPQLSVFLFVACIRAVWIVYTSAFLNY